MAQFPSCSTKVSVPAHPVSQLNVASDNEGSDGEMIESKVELVRFVNIQNQYTSGSDIAVDYVTDATYLPGSHDWIGVYHTGQLQTDRYVCYQWSEQHFSDIKTRKRRTVFPAAQLKNSLRESVYDKEQHSYKFQYITYNQDILGSTTEFCVFDGPLRLLVPHRNANPGYGFEIVDEDNRRTGHQQDSSQFSGFSLGLNLTTDPNNPGEVKESESDYSANRCRDLVLYQPALNRTFLEQSRFEVSPTLFDLCRAALVRCVSRELVAIHSNFSPRYINREHLLQQLKDNEITKFAIEDRLSSQLTPQFRKQGQLEFSKKSAFQHVKCTNYSKLTDTKNESISFQESKLQRRIATLDKKVARLNRKLRISSNTILMKDELLSLLSTQFKHKVRDMANLECANEKLFRKINRLKSSRAKAQRSNATQTANEEKAKLVCLHKRLKKTNSRLSKEMSHNVTLNQEFYALKTEYGNLEQTLDNVIFALSQCDLKGSLQDINGNAFSIEKGNVFQLDGWKTINSKKYEGQLVLNKRKDKTIKILSFNLNSMKDNYQRISVKNKTISKNYNQLKKDFNLKVEEQSWYQNRITQLESSLAEQQLQLRAVSDSRAAQESRAARAERANADLQADLRASVTREQTLSRAMSQLQHQLSQLQRREQEQKSLAELRIKELLENCPDDFATETNQGFTSDLKTEGSVHKGYSPFFKAGNGSNPDVVPANANAIRSSLPKERIQHYTPNEETPLINQYKNIQAPANTARADEKHATTSFSNFPTRNKRAHEFDNQNERAKVSWTHIRNTIMKESRESLEEALNFTPNEAVRSTFSTSPQSHLISFCAKETDNAKLSPVTNASKKKDKKLKKFAGFAKRVTCKEQKTSKKDNVRESLILPVKPVGVVDGVIQSQMNRGSPSPPSPNNHGIVASTCSVTDSNASTNNYMTTAKSFVTSTMSAVESLSTMFDTEKSSGLFRRTNQSVCTQTTCPSKLAVKPVTQSLHVKPLVCDTCNVVYPPAADDGFKEHVRFCKVRRSHGLV